MATPLCAIWIKGENMPHAADLEVQGIPGTDVQLVRFGGNELTDTSQAVKIQNDFFEIPVHGA